MESYDSAEMIVNPYAVGPAEQGISMNDSPRHDSGNALAANAEARAVAEVKAQVLMARQFPRNPAVAMDNILRECQRPTLAEAAVFSFPRGKEQVTGPSIRLAEVLARNWGNNTYGYEVLERKKDEYGVGFSIIRAFAWDLETNTYISRQFELKHFRSTRSGGYKLTDDRDIYELEANMASRRIRACILQMIPGDVTAEAVKACRYTESSGLTAKMSDPNERQKVVMGTIKVFERMGVSRADLEEYLKSKVEDWTADNMLRLKEIKNALDDGVTTLGDYFPHLAGGERNETITKDQTKKLMEAAKATGRQGEISRELKKMGIAKYADVPAVKFDEVLHMIQGFAEPAEDAPSQIEAPAEPESETPAPQEATK